MQITEVRINLVNRDYFQPCYPPVLRAVFSIIVDNVLVIHGLKLIEDERNCFLAMPSERKTSRCYDCKRKNPLTDRYCGYCGVELLDDRLDYFEKDKNGKVQQFCDMIHPLTREVRDYITDICRTAYRKELSCPGSVLPLMVKENKNVFNTK